MFVMQVWGVHGLRHYCDSPSRSRIHVQGV
jgi:hypothetical protein